MTVTWFYGIMVCTLDFESKDPSSNLGRTRRITHCPFFPIVRKELSKRNGFLKIHFLFKTYTEKNSSDTILGTVY